MSILQTTQRFSIQSLGILTALLLSAQLLASDASASAEKPHVVFLIGEDEYKSEKTLPTIAADLEDHLGMKYTLLFDEHYAGAWKPEVGQRSNSFPGIDVLEDADLLVMYLRFRTLPENQLTHLQAYVDAGKPIVGIRTSTHAFHYAKADPLAEHWNSFGTRVLGAPWIYHYGHTSSTDVSRIEAMADHPILTGVPESFHVRSWLYHVQPDYPPESATPLLIGHSVGPGRGQVDERKPNPVAWTHTHPGGGRVFTTTMGHPEDFKHPAYRRLLLNGIHWALQREIPDPWPVPNRPHASPPCVEQVVDVAPVWSGHVVGFDLLTRGRTQYVAFYDADRRMTVGKRHVNSTDWEFVTLPSKVGWDSHNYITMALDRKGVLHVSGNMHGDPLVYFRADKPHDVGTLKKIEAMIGREGDRCTYPKFLKAPDNRLVYMYRDGGSGNGRRIFNVYDEESQSWSRLIDKPLLDGQGKMNAYPYGPIRDRHGVYHMCWVWRDTPDAATNHDLCYARSKDLVHWETSTGQSLTLPITLASGEIVDPVPPGRGLLNSCIALGFDHRDRPILSYQKNDADNHTQIYNARHENGEWKIRQASDWAYHWDFGGRGTIVQEISIGPVSREADGRLTQRFRHVKHGSGVWTLDPETLRPTGRSKPTPKLPRDIQRPDSKTEGMQVRTREDSGKDVEPGARYILRWESRGTNRDRPHEGEIPPPSMLRVIKLDTTLE